MRLHRITLRNVKGVRERTVDLPEHGLVVVEGPNEVGKSTMLEAFDALLTYKSSSRAAEIRGLKPVDRDEGPSVEAEFTLGRVRLRYAKQWLRQPSTTLQVLGERPEQLTGDAAQQRADALLRTHLDRTLYDALRLTQSADGTLAPLSSSAVLTEALDAAAGARLHSDGAEAILDQVEKEYRLYFTGTGRPTGDYRAAMTRFTQEQQEVAEAHRRLEEGRELLQRQEEARAAATVAEVDLVTAQDDLDRAEVASQAAEEVAAEHARALERLGQERELHRAAVRAQAQRSALVAEHRSLEVAIESARTAREADAARAVGLQEGLVSAQSSADEAVLAVEQASDLADAARSEADRLADLRDLAAAESLLERATTLAERVRQAHESQPRRPVEREHARRVRALQDRLDALVVQHAAASPTLEIESLGPSVRVSMADSDRDGEESVDAGAVRRLSLSHDTALEVPGQVRIRVLLHEEALGRVALIHQVKDQLEAALEELGVSKVDNVEALAEATETARGALREATRDLESLLVQHGGCATQAPPGTVPAALVEHVDRARRRVAGHAAAEQGRELPADDIQARAAVDAASARLRAAVTSRREAEAALAARRQEVAQLTRRLDQATGRLEADEARLQALTNRLTTARAEAADHALDASVDAYAARVTSAQEQAARTAAAVAAADVERVRTAHEEARRRLQTGTRRRDEARARLHALGGQVAMAASEGRQELYDQAVARLDEAERELQAVDRRARAARHLRTTLQQHRDDAHRLYVQPYTQALEELGRRVYGPGFAVAVDDELTLTSRTLDGMTVPWADLSGGAKEQLGILARLAVARLVDREHGCPVVIDDALGYTDPQRLRQMGAVLGGAAGSDGDLQVILLTCTPDRYAAIPHVQTVRLTA